MIPTFGRDGNLPAGIHEARWDEFAARFGQISHNQRRQRLLDGLQRGLTALRAAGCQIAYIGGSFVTRERWPHDFDACWEVESVDGDALDPIFFDFMANRAAQKAKFGGEFFPSGMLADRYGNSFLEYFQRDKNTGKPKGIVKISLETLP
jgi:hypothetical protein